MVVDTRTQDERDEEIAMQERVRAALNPDTTAGEREAMRKLQSREKTAEGGMRVKTPGGSVRRVKFDQIGEEKATAEKKKKGGSKGLRPSFPVQRTDMLQYPQFTNYFDGDDGAAFQEEHQSAGAPPDHVVEQMRLQAQQSMLPPGTGESIPIRAMQEEAPEPKHPLEEATPLPRTSNMQVLEPIDQYEAPWDTHKPPTGTRGYGMAPKIDLYGNPHVNLPIPKTLLMQPSTEGNERYAAIEDPVRRTLKTMSAQNMQMGGVGIGGRDPTRGFLLHPLECSFGRVAQGVEHVIRLTIMNGGIDAARLQVRKPKGLEVHYKTGMVAAGMSVVLQVVLRKDNLGPVDEEMQIVTENEIFRLPITADVMTQEDYNALQPNQQSKAPLYKPPPKAQKISREPPASATPVLAEEGDEEVLEDSP